MHDEKFNVMSIAEVEIYVDKVTETALQSIRAALIRPRGSRFRC